MALKGRVPQQDWGYVNVRSDAHMFWWLYYATHATKNYTDVPLVMWLQGGPGASGCGYGNFEEIGPYDTYLHERNTTWVKEASVLFVDNPVGTGFSYTTNDDAFAKDVSTVSADMIVLLKDFFNSKTEFQKIPFYIFSESYGGKMAAAISLALNKEIKSGRIKCNFGGVALGDSWISPVDSVLSWGPYLYSASLLDDQGLSKVKECAKEVQNAVKNNQFDRATELWSKTEDVVEQYTDNVNFYNILTKESTMDYRNKFMENSKFGNNFLGKLFQRHLLPRQNDYLSELMNGPIRKVLKIIPDDVMWGGQAQDVFAKMAGDFMKPVIDIVDELLSENINVTVYNGQLDLIVDTVGQENWVKQLKWQKMVEFRNRVWSPLHMCPQCTETVAFHKSYENFSFFWILKAGHMIPSDQGQVALKMLRMIISKK
ncbi:retinoid-inducible serine carboxypeptidase isoform X1 [Pelobates cultripes]|uniref:Carboxypeptidase n=1 Tax=Pelobates cultripes TaxID=61616 RepID=A0AAD1W7R8_PELCU|nr:retinoid-inducible serine carboxypeptidase isoform X1 [Pelobates cultripes]